MEELKVRRLPVINKDKRMVGVLSRHDIAHARLRSEIRDSQLGLVLYCDAAEYEGYLNVMRAIKKANRGPRAAGGGDPLITVRLPASLLALVKTWAKARGINRSAAVRSLLELELGVPGREDAWRRTVKNAASCLRVELQTASQRCSLSRLKEAIGGWRIIVPWGLHQCRYPCR